MPENSTGFLVAQEVQSILSSLKTLKNNKGLVMASDLHTIKDGLASLTEAVEVPEHEIADTLEMPF